MAGMYSEATAAHPYSQRANIELGAHETGFLLGWIPASVSNDAAGEARRGRQSAALFYTKLNDGHERAGLRARAPPGDRRPDAASYASCAGRWPSRRAGAELAERTELHVAVDADHNLALITRRTCRAPTSRPPSPPSATTSSTAPASTRSTSTCRWSSPATALVADHLERLGVSYAGRLPQQPLRRRRAAHAVPAPCPDQGRRRRRRLRARPGTARLRPRRPARA